MKQLLLAVLIALTMTACAQGQKQTPEQLQEQKYQYALATAKKFTEHFYRGEYDSAIVMSASFENEYKNVYDIVSEIKSDCVTGDREFCALDSNFTFELLGSNYRKDQGGEGIDRYTFFFKWKGDYYTFLNVQNMDYNGEKTSSDKWLCSVLISNPNTFLRDERLIKNLKSERGNDE